MLTNSNLESNNISLSSFYDHAGINHFNPYNQKISDFQVPANRIPINLNYDKTVFLHSNQLTALSKLSEEEQERLLDGSSEDFIKAVNKKIIDGKSKRITLNSGETILLRMHQVTALNKFQKNEKSRIKEFSIEEVIKIVNKRFIILFIHIYYITIRIIVNII